MRIHALFKYLYPHDSERRLQKRMQLTKKLDLYSNNVWLTRESIKLHGHDYSHDVIYIKWVIQSFDEVEDKAALAFELFPIRDGQKVHS